MWWTVLVAAVLGAIAGEWIGRSYFVWGALVGALIAKAFISGRGAPASEVGALRAQVERLSLELDRLAARGVDARVGETPSSARETPAEGQGPSVQNEPVERPEAVQARREASDLAADVSSSAPQPRRARVTDRILRGDRPEGAGSDARLREAVYDGTPEYVSAGASGDVPRNPLMTAWNWLFGENAVVRVGIIILFIGVAFLMRYAYERVQVPIELRLIGIAVGAVALLLLGWYLRERRRGYALALQGGAVGLLYLTVFGALRLWDLMPAGPAFVLLLAIAGGAAALAILQDALALAVIGVAGGFLAPVLASTGSGDHVMLFTFYSALNVGIGAIAWFKAWRGLNAVGFAFTFVIAWVWGERYYRPEHFTTTEPFLIFHFLLYVAIPLLFARRKAAVSQPYVDGALVFGVPIVVFSSQWALLRDSEYGVALSAIAFGAFYLGLGSLLWRRAEDHYRMLVEAFLALGTIFATLAIPLGLSGRWTAAAWAIEGAGLAWVGLRQSHLATRVFGLLLQFGAGVALVVGENWLRWPPEREHGFALGAVMLASAGLFTSWQFRKHAGVLRPSEPVVQAFAFVWGSLWWLLAGWREAHTLWHDAHWHGAYLVFATVSALTARILGERMAWPHPVHASQCLPLFGLLVFLLIIDGIQPPHAHLGWLAWPFFFVVHYRLLHRYPPDEAPVRSAHHLVGFWLALILLTWELNWLIHRAVPEREVWGDVVWGALPAAALLLLATLPDRIRWPVTAHPQTYLQHAAIPVALYLLLWSLVTNFELSGDPQPLPYVPMANPLELVHGIAFVAVLLWMKALRDRSLGGWVSRFPPALVGILGFVAFVLVNGMLMRTLHHWGGVPFDLESMFLSNLAQATFSIAWSVLALALMFVGAKGRGRSVWFAGAGLLGLVVFKLLLIDLAQRATVERIVSFIGVGLLMLVIGYFAPMPPRGSRDTGSSPDAGVTS